MHGYRWQGSHDTGSSVASWLWRSLLVVFASYVVVSELAVMLVVFVFAARRRGFGERALLVASSDLRCEVRFPAALSARVDVGILLWDGLVR